MNRVKPASCLIIGISFMISLQVFAESDADLAKAAQNPVADLISVPFQNNTNFGIGPEDRTQNILNIQPVWPITLNDNWNLITRTILPVISQPGIVPGEDSTFGLGDITFTAFLSPKKSNKVTWGVGPVVLLPTSTDDALGNGEWGLGASVVMLAMPGNWVIGSLFSNVWSVGSSEPDDVNFFSWQYFINYNLPSGLYLATAPIITANWEADSDNRWTVPFGIGVGKVLKIGARPVNTSISAYYNVEKSEFGADWQLRIQAQLLFPK